MLRLLALTLFLASAFGVAACTAIPHTQYLMAGVKNPDMNSNACWVQPPNSDLWYLCGSEAMKDKECLNLYETLMNQAEADYALTGSIGTSTLKLWERTKQTCFAESRATEIPHTPHTGHM